MKKLICVLLVLSFIAGFSATAFADMLPYRPSFNGRESEAVVTNSSGAADVNDPDKVIPFGATVFIQGYRKDSNDNIIVKAAYNDVINIGTESSFQVSIDDLSGPGVESIKKYEAQKENRKQPTIWQQIIFSIIEPFYKLYIKASELFQNIKNRITDFGEDIINLKNELHKVLNRQIL
ncbi:MAG: hypothetical protein K6B52_02870 [Clostridiales bacterium]|nr:hypothetical protein [Clostridiales bacterium]